MAGTTDNVTIWQNADVYIAPVGSTAPTNVTTAWDPAWEAVGLLDGDEGFTEKRDESSDEFFAWGGLFIRRTRSKQKRTFRFVALEDNPVVFDLVNPGSTRSGTTLITSTYKALDYVEFSVGMETTDGLKIRRRIIPKATLEEVGDRKETESGLAVVDVTVAVIPASDGTLYTELYSATGS